MRKRSFLVLAGVTAVAVVAAVVLQPSGRVAAFKGSGKLVSPELPKAINNVHSITIARRAGTLTIIRAKDGWRLKERGGYPVKPESVKQILVGLSGMKTLEPKTDRKDRYERLQLREIAHKDSKSQLVTVTGPDNKTLAKLIIGKVSAGRFGPGQVYFRRPGQKRAWKAEGDLSIDNDATNWLVKPVMDIRKTRVRHFAVSRASGESVAAERPKPGEALKLTTDPLPDGMVPKTDGTVGSLANALDKLDLVDVREVSKIDWKTKTVATAEIRSYDGVVITARVAQTGKNEFWVRFEASFDADDTLAPKDAALKKLEIKSAAEAKKEVAGLTAGLKGWAFKLSKRNLNLLKIELKEVLEKKKKKSS